MIAQPRAVTFGSQDRKFHSPSGCPVNLMEMKDRAVSCKPKGNTDLDGLTDNVPIERLLSARFPLLVRNNDNTKLKSYLSVILLSTSYIGCKALIDVNGNDTRFFMAKGHRWSWNYYVMTMGPVKSVETPVIGSQLTIALKQYSRYLNTFNSISTHIQYTFMQIMLINYHNKILLKDTT